MKKVILLLSLCFSFPIMAQPVLEKSCNMFRDGDRLIKQQVEYKSPGEDGANRFWDFGGLKLIDEHYGLSYAGGDSLMVGHEHRTLYKYTLRNDSLFSLGYENPTTLMNYHLPELQLVFPVHYQNKGGSAYSGEGEYCGRLELTTQGESDFIADAYGMILLPSGDTLNNVLRIHYIKKIAGRVMPESGDSLDMQVDTYRWYADGYRYPVFETVESKYLKGQEMVKHFATAFYYTPEEQYYSLSKDDENMEKRERNELETIKKQSEKLAKHKGVDERQEKTIEYQLTYNKEQNSLVLNYQLLKEDVDIEILLFDVQGRAIEAYPKERMNSGYYEKVIPMNTNPEGQYLLRIKVNEDVVGEKIVKL